MAMFGTSATARHAYKLPCRLLNSLPCLMLFACSAGSGDGLNVSGRPLSEGGDVPLAATLASIQANVFDTYCIVCHSGAGAPQGLRLDAASSYGNLVGVASQQVSSLFRVSPGQPDASYLVRKLEGTASIGEPMPLGGPPLPTATITFVRQWIIDGARPDSGPPPATPPVVLSLSVDPGSIIGSLPLQINASFDRDIDASTVNAMTFTLTRSGGDGQFGDANDEVIVPAFVELSMINARLAIMDLGGVTPVEDQFRIQLSGSGANRILDVDGTALDGEFTGSFPSGDGTEGGDFSADFTVQGIQPTLSSIQNNVFTPICSVCHTGPSGPALPSGMDLSSAAASFANLVNVASLQQAAILRVAAADADGSYLIHKLEGSASVGGRMPQGGPFLDQSTIDVIRDWIDQGAQP